VRRPVHVIFAANEISMWKYIKENLTTILLGLFVVLMIVSPGVKSWVLQQLMRTGLFNAKIENKVSDTTRVKPADFDFANINDRKQNTSTLRGKVVFVNFWASWCPPCRAELPSIQAFYDKFKNNPDFFVLTISEDDDLSIAGQFLEKQHFTIPLYKAISKVPDLLYTGTLPTTIILDKQGNVRYKHEGFANYSSDNFLKQMEDLMNE
jgi:thiol-disulfide isomerase/thioredoxin